MDEKTISRLFDPFFTTKRNRGGIGLGMHVVHNLITQTLKGRIEVSSSLGTGTRFFITIPITPPV
jgi:signal transduction histidine kinase